MEEEVGDYRISRWTAEFAAPGVEREFRAATHEAVVHDTRVAITIAALFYLAFAVTDYLAVGAGQSYEMIFLTRLVICAAGIVVAIGAGRFWRPLLDGLTPTVVESLALAGFLSITLLRPYESGWHGMSLMVMLLGLYVFIPNRFLLATLVAVTSTLVFVWLLVQHFQPPANYILTLSLLLAAINMFGILTAHRISRLKREEYRDATTLRLANTRLSREIETRQRLEAELRELALRDHLTGISNRRHFFDLADQAFARARETGEPLALLIVDIDYFKQINDTYGHVHGDEVLKVLVQVCRAALGDVEMLARLGGEEFVMLLPNTDLNAATTRAERLRAEVQRTPVRFHETSLYFTISLGVAQWQPEESLLILMRRADEALYAAKYNGRNRIETASPHVRWGALEPGGAGGENRTYRPE
ncbi:MAG TPA: diguanylate cyclase [Thiobacillaceae bacterium]|nr:diguanylate cyclase [Thiobacillaceae bacterium]HNF88538.1 diguanylate cyclase [Thiobacillaceae bacterium]HNI08223.1 diguanylate cyclase [Thiobacillaceae bacterium]